MKVTYLSALSCPTLATVGVPGLPVFLCPTDQLLPSFSSPYRIELTGSGGPVAQLECVLEWVSGVLMGPCSMGTCAVQGHQQCPNRAQDWRCLLFAFRFSMNFWEWGPRIKGSGLKQRLLENQGSWSGGWKTAQTVPHSCAPSQCRTLALCPIS